MEEDRRDGPPVVGHEPIGDRGERRQLSTGYLAALVIAVVFVAGGAYVGSWIDIRRNPNVEAAGLSGLVLGGGVGIVLVFATAAAALLAARRHRSSVLRAAGQGLLVTLGLLVLMAGICAVVR